MKVSREEFKAIRAKAKLRASRRLERVSENAALAGESKVGVPSPDSSGPGTRKDAPGGVGPLSGKGIKAPRPPKRRKKSLFVRLRDTLDDEAQAYAALRDRSLGCRIGKAAQCTGKSEVGYHILPRGKWAVRWDLDLGGIGNIVGACGPCNAGERWHRLTYADYHREIFGDDFYEALTDKSYARVKHSSLDLQRMLDDVRARVKKLLEGAAC